MSARRLRSKRKDRIDTRARPWERSLPRQHLGELQQEALAQHRVLHLWSVRTLWASDSGTGALHCGSMHCKWEENPSSSVAVMYCRQQLEQATSWPQDSFTFLLRGENDSKHTEQVCMVTRAARPLKSRDCLACCRHT